MELQEASNVTGSGIFTSPPTTRQHGRVYRKSSGRQACVTSSTAAIASSVLLCLPLLLLPTASGRRVENPLLIGRQKTAVHHRLNRQFLPKGLTGVIRCPAQAEPPRRMIVWIKEDRGVLSVERNHEEVVDDNWDEEEEEDESDDPAEGVEEQLELEDRIAIDMAGLLTISDVTWSDSGTYKCTLYSPVDGNDETYTINVYVRDPAVFTVRPSVIYQRLIGQSVTMPCVADGDPRPNIHWIKVDDEFPSTTRTLLEEGNLTIVHLNPDDHGLYECIATNIVARTITTALLIIHANSFNVPYNVTVDMTTETTAVVSWLPAYSIHHHHHYVLWFKKQGGKHARWHTISINSDDVTSVIVHELHPDTTYRFMVMSRDDQNEAHFSDVVLARTLAGASATARPVDSDLQDVDDEHPVHPVHPVHWMTPPSTHSTTTSTGVAVINRTFGSREFETSFATSCLPEADTTQPSVDVGRVRRPSPPNDVRATQSVNGQKPGAICISWTVPVQAKVDENDSPVGTVPVDHYAIEYRTDAEWLPLVDRVDAATTRTRTAGDDEVETGTEVDLGRNRTMSFTWIWTEASPGVVHQFRVISVSQDSVQSDPSETATLHIADPLVHGVRVSSDVIGGVIGGLLFCLLSVTLIVVAFKFCYSRRRTSKRRDISAAPRTVNNQFGHRLAAVDNNTRIAIETPI